MSVFVTFLYFVVIFYFFYLICHKIIYAQNIIRSLQEFLFFKYQENNFLYWIYYKRIKSLFHDKKCFVSMSLDWKDAFAHLIRYGLLPCTVEVFCTQGYFLSGNNCVRWKSGQNKMPRKGPIVHCSSYNRAWPT